MKTPSEAAQKYPPQGEFYDEDKERNMELSAWVSKSRDSSERDQRTSL